MSNELEIAGAEGLLAGQEMINMTVEERAAAVHAQLRTHITMMAQGLVGTCQDLKTIRDEKLYKQLGYAEFGEYTEREHGIKERQAYKYIKVFETYGIQFLHSSANAEIGVTKLLEIAALDGEGREKLLSEHAPEELSALSTAEVQQLVEEIASLKRQLSFLEEEACAADSEPAEHEPAERELTADEAELREKIEQELRAEIEAEAAAKEAEEIKKLEAELQRNRSVRTDVQARAERLAVELENARAERDAAKAAAKEAEGLRARLEAVEADAKKNEAAVRLSANPELTKFKILFEAAQDAFGKMLEQLKNVEPDAREKCAAAIRKYMEVIKL
jgi:hypothetical protein